MGIKAVFFDLDGTLYDRDVLVQELVADQHAAFAGELSGLSRERFISRVLEMDDHGYGDKALGYQQIVAEWGLELGLAHRLCDYFCSHYDRPCRLPTDTATTLQTLKAHDKRLGVITNGGTDRQRAKLASLGLLSTFDVVLISEAEGVRKPSAEIFRRALRRCQVQADESVFVGDHPETDIEGARNAGLLPIWKHVSYWPLVTDDVPTVRRLVDILPICLRPS
jgi:putative hydrolase of the HAD superfamily